MLPFTHLKSGEKTREKGVVLILVLGILSILVIIALEYTLSMRLELKIAQKFLYTKDAAFAADTGIQEIVRMIRTKYTLDSDSWYGSGATSFQTRAYTFLDEEWATGVQHTDTDDTGMQYDTRYGTTEGIGLSSNFQDDTTDGHFIQGVQDEQGKINLNTSEEETVNNLEWILGNPVASKNLGYDLELYDVQDTYDAINEAFSKSSANMTGNAFYGEDYGSLTRGDTNDHITTNKDDDSNSILLPGMEDFLTVHSEVTTDSGVLGGNPGDRQRDTFDEVPYALAPINVNTASWIVLQAEFSTVLNFADDARILASAVINYRTGGDGAHGDGDDDPFDGFYSHTNTSIYQASFTAVTAFEADGIDNDGNGWDDWSDTQIYAGGARGEFESFLDQVASQEGDISQEEADQYKNHFSIIHIRDFEDGGGVSAVRDGKISHGAVYSTAHDLRSEGEPFCFSSNTFSITSVGKKRRPSGETGAIVKRRWIIQMDVP